MKYKVIIPFFLVLSIIQYTMINIFNIGGVAMNLPLCFFIISTMIFDEEEKGLIVIGVLSLFQGSVLGVYLLGYSLVFLLLSILKEILNQESKITTIISLFLSNIIFQIIVYLIPHLKYGGFSFYRLLYIIGISTVWNIVIGMIFYEILKRIFKKKTRRSMYERYEII